jgi:phage terminase small subunit
MAKKTPLKQIFNKSPWDVGSKRDSLNKRLNTPVKPLSEQKKTVTPQQWTFIQELVCGDGKMTMAQAAIAAGYSEAGATDKAYELTDPRKSPHVVAAIQQYRRDLAERYGTTFDRHMRDMQIIRDKALEAGNYSAAVQAEYRRGQALGTIYVERKEIRHGTIDSMSAEEVRRKLEEIKLMYGDPSQVIDVTPTAHELIEQDKMDEIDDEDVEESAEDSAEETSDEKNDNEAMEQKSKEGLRIIEEMREKQKAASAEDREKRGRIKNCP